MGQGRRDAQATSDHPVAESGIPEGEDLFTADLRGGTSDPLPESPRPLEARDHALPDQVPLELGEHGKHAEHGPAG